MIMLTLRQSKVSEGMLMKKYSKIMKCSLLLCLLFSSMAQATQTFISLGGGYTSFSENYASTSHIKGTFGLMSPSGIIYDLSVGYSEAKEQGDLRHFKVAPILVGASYIFNPKRKITPYIGILTGMNILPSDYNSPGFTLGGKTGFLFKIDRELTWFLEASYLTATDSNTELNINPLNIGIGLAMNLRSEGKKRGIRPVKKQKVKSEYQKRKQKRRRRAEKRRY